MNKDHSNIFNFQALKYDHRFDFQDRQLNFKNTSIIMTSNAGSKTHANNRSNIIGYTFGEKTYEGRYLPLKIVVISMTNTTNL